MKFKIIVIFCFFNLLGCTQYSLDNSKEKVIKFENKYKNSGFALVYNDNLKIKNLDNRSLQIFHKNLKKKIFCKNI